MGSGQRQGQSWPLRQGGRWSRTWCDVICERDCESAGAFNGRAGSMDRVGVVAAGIRGRQDCTYCVIDKDLRRLDWTLKCLVDWRVRRRWEQMQINNAGERRAS